MKTWKLDIEKEDKKQRSELLGNLQKSLIGDRKKTRSLFVFGESKKK